MTDADGRADWPIVIGGCFRSGTSLIRRMLDAHSRIYCGAEVKFFRDLHGDYRDDPIRHGRFMTSARAMLPAEELLEVLGRAFVEMHRRAAARAGKARWADKTPENVVHLAEWGRLLGERWVFVHVVRNPLDTLASIDEAAFDWVLPVDLDGRLAVYRRYAEAGLAFGRAHPGRYHRVVYEELVASPAAVMARLMTWLGEALEPVQLSFNSVPHDAGLEDPKVARTAQVHARSVNRWPQTVSAETARTIWARTGDLWALMDDAGSYAPEL